MSVETVLKYMIDNDLLDHKKYMVSHHLVDTPSRIDVKTDEVVYIDKIFIKNYNSACWLEFHSATESRLIKVKKYEQITRHKGHIYFSRHQIDKFKISYIKLRLIDDRP